MFLHYRLGHAEISRATKIETSFLPAPKTAVSHCRKWQYSIPFRDAIRGLLACDLFLMSPAMSEKRTLFESPPPVPPVADSTSAAEQTPFEIRFASRVMRLPPYLFARINALLYQKRRAG